jgi:cysteinyl-tRNA synthetase
MSHKYLGPDFDIHGGGGDLVFPHHENEVAQSEAYMDGKRLARYWMHNAFITVDKEKMSKSEGNFFLVRDVLKEYSGEVIRFFLLSAHYRSPADFDQEQLEMAAKGLERLKTSVRLADEALAGVGSGDGSSEKESPEKRNLEMENQVSGLGQQATEARNKFIEAMDDDFNTAQGLAVLFDLARDLNSLVSRGDVPVADIAALRQILVELADVLGFDVAAKGIDDSVADGKVGVAVGIIAELLKRAQEAGDEDTGLLIRERCAGVGIDAATEEFSGTGMVGVMEIVMELRARARAARDWGSADLIRERCKESGIVIEDTRDGVRWYVQDGN